MHYNKLYQLYAIPKKILEGSYMPLTVEKLRRRIFEMGRAAEGAGIAISPVYLAPATGAMTPPPAPSDASWQQVEVGQVWGAKHGTTWVMALLQIPEAMLHHPVVLQLPWDTRDGDSLLLRLEATVFLDGQAIGALDWRHQSLLLPEMACDGQPHTLTLQVYTSVPLPFIGLTIHPRYEITWQLSSLMETVFEALLTLGEDDIARHTLLDRLNTAYTMLDLREGWHSERFLASAHDALDYLHLQLTAGLTSGNQPRITISGHAHLDLAWQWPYWRSRQKIAHTISNVLALMDRYPSYHYSQSQPQALQWLKEDLPDVYARVKERVAEGRFELVGAMWVEADCNLTSGESLVRQIMQGTRFLQQEFGFTPRHIWLPDVFGYSAALPQIMRGCDLPVFMTTKISWNQFNRMPCDTFRWCGIDGSEVLTHFITAPDVHTTTTYYTYNGPTHPADMTGTWKNYRQQAINDNLLYLCGWGDGGGGPTEDQLERIGAMKGLPDFPVVRMGRADEYFELLYQRVWENPRLPTWVGELYLEYHRGTYTSQARTKQANRRAELFYREVELLNAWAGLYGMPSRQEQLNEGWRRILLNQFHDVLPGSSIGEVYEDAARLYAEARTIGEQIRDEALAVLSEHLGWTERQIVLLNTLPWERNEPVQAPTGSELAREDGQEVSDWDGNRLLLLDGVRVPSCGACVVSASAVEDEDEASEEDCAAIRAGNGEITLSNQYYELCLDANGEVSSLYDKRAEREVLAGGQTGNQLIAYEDRPLRFDAWDIDIFYEEKPYPVREVERIEIIEEGPIRTTVEIVRRFLASRITQRLSLWRNSPRIDIATEIDWHEHQMVLKAAFPLEINSAQATYEIQFGSVQRPTHRNTSWDLARFEVCAHRWVDLSEGGYGVSLLNDSKYGHDIHDNVMRLTLLKSGIMPDPNADQGLHRFTYSLLPHQGDWREAQVVRRAYELNAPILSVTGSASARAGESESAASTSFMHTDCPHVVLETAKPAEDGDGVIVRLYEAHNQRGHGAITFATPILSAQECNLLEAPRADAPYHGNTLHFYVSPFEIKTFRVRLAPA
jgi:alpha-mannosidase